MATVRADGLEKAYGDTVALRGVSLAIDAGEVFGLLGPNGAGKTTLIRCLTGTATPDAGTVELLGTGPRTVEHDRIGVLPQDFRPPARLTARELIEYYAGLYDDPRPIEAVLSAVGLEDSADTRYANLSGGEQRRTCVGLTVVNDPAVLVLDEPTTGIDPAGRRAVWSLIEDLATGGTTVLLTTHYTEEAERLADRVGVLVDGELAATAAPEALTATHGGPPRLVIETDAAPTALADRLDNPVRRSDRGLVIDGVDPDGIPAALDAIEAAGVTYDALTWREPSLETVYLELAGDRARAEPRGDSSIAGGSS